MRLLTVIFALLCTISSLSFAADLTHRSQEEVVAAAEALENSYRVKIRYFSSENKDPSIIGTHVRAYKYVGFSAFGQPIYVKDGYPWDSVWMQLNEMSKAFAKLSEQGQGHHLNEMTFVLFSTRYADEIYKEIPMKSLAPVWACNMHDEYNGLLKIPGYDQSWGESDTEGKGAISKGVGHVIWLKDAMSRLSIGSTCFVGDLIRDVDYLLDTDSTKRVIVVFKANDIFQHIIEHAKTYKAPKP